MLLRGQNSTVFELIILRYEHPEAGRDQWRMNLLRVALFVRSADGNEGKCATYLLTGEVRELKEWLEKLSQKMPDAGYFESYFGVFRFDWLSYAEKGVRLRIVFYLSGKELQLSPGRDYVSGWSGQIDFSLSFAQITGGIRALEEALSRFPERSSNSEKKGVADGRQSK